MEQGKECRHIWIEIVRDGSYDTNKHDGKRVCHYCKKELGFNPHPRFDTMLGKAELLMDAGKLDSFDTSMVKQCLAAKELTPGQTKVIEGIVKKHA